MPGVPGDYNDNGTVDAADYVLWRNGGPLQNEVDTPGVVNAADYTAWRTRFGNSGSGAGANANAAVPEPATFVLLIFGGWLVPPATPGRLVSSINSSTRETRQQPTVVWNGKIAGCIGERRFPRHAGSAPSRLRDSYSAA